MILIYVLLYYLKDVKTKIYALKAGLFYFKFLFCCNTVESTQVRVQYVTYIDNYYHWNLLICTLVIIFLPLSYFYRKHSISPVIF